MPIAQTTTYWKIRELEDKEDVNIYLLQGGQGAGKNGGMALRLLERAEEGGIFRNTITIMTDTYDNLKDGAISDFEFVFEQWGMNFYDYYNKLNKVCTWFGVKIQFRYLDDNKPDKGKGARRGILYINEGNRTGWEAVKHYIARSQEVYVDFNPDMSFWAHEELEPLCNCEKIIITYKDNEMCPVNEVNYIESRRHKTEWFRVYGQGLTGTYSERRIYDFKVVENIPEDAIQISSGMDFGKSPDPTVLINCYIKGTSLYVDEVFIENNLEPEKIQGSTRMSVVDRLDVLEFPKTQLIIGDSAGATEIRDINKHGYYIRSVKKTAVLLGMKRLSAYDICVTKRSAKTVKAFSNWLYDLDKNGKILPQPPKAHEPDTIAAIRYVAMARKLWEHFIPKIVKQIKL